VTDEQNAHLDDIRDQLAYEAQFSAEHVTREQAQQQVVALDAVIAAAAKPPVVGLRPDQQADIGGAIACVEHCAKLSRDEGDIESAEHNDDLAADLREILREAGEPTDKPPVVVGLTDKERNAIEVARFFVAAHGGGKSFEVIDTLDAMLDSDPGEYVAVRREDLQHAANMLWGYHYRLQETVGQSDSSLPKQHAEKLERLLAPAIAKGGEQ
jgi:hypothetical protein